MPHALLDRGSQPTTPPPNPPPTHLYRPRTPPDRGAGTQPHRPGPPHEPRRTHPSRPVATQLGGARPQPDNPGRQATCAASGPVRRGRPAPELADDTVDDLTTTRTRVRRQSRRATGFAKRSRQKEEGQRRGRCPSRSSGPASRSISFYQPQLSHGTTCSVVSAPLASSWLVAVAVTSAVMIH